MKYKSRTWSERSTRDILISRPIFIYIYLLFTSALHSPLPLFWDCDPLQTLCHCFCHGYFSGKVVGWLGDDTHTKQVYDAFVFD